jgi:hypothetical protein
MAFGFSRVTMLSKLPTALRALVFLLPVACSEKQSGGSGNAPNGGAAGASGDDRLFVPEDLPHAELNGEGGLTLIALTLIDGETGPELYAAVRNDGTTPACEAGLLTDFYDKSDALVVSTSGVLSSGRLYQFDDGSGVVISCVPPGDIAMTASTELPDTVVIDDLGRLQYTLPAFVVDGIVPIEGLGVTGVETVVRGTASAYTGTLTNGLDVTVQEPKVTIFPVNRVGRPLGAATSGGTADVPAGGTWAFETSTVAELGTSYAAFARATIP